MRVSQRAHQKQIMHVFSVRGKSFVAPNSYSGVVLIPGTPDCTELDWIRSTRKVSRTSELRAILLSY